MPSFPWLLEYGQLGRRIAKPWFLSRSRYVFGELAERVWERRLPDSLSCKPPRDFSKELEPEWLKAMACEALLLPPEQRNHAVFAKLPDDLKPFDSPSVPTYGELKRDYTVAGALFPLASQDNTSTPQLARVWAFKGPRIFTDLAGAEGADDLITRSKAEGISLLIEPPAADQAFTGPSWQLAAQLACRVVMEESDTTRIELARVYLTTGGIKNDDVTSIKIGNKQIVSKNDLVRRVWIVPRHDQEAFQAAWRIGQEIPVTYVDTVEDAFREVAGFGARPKAEKQWPAEVPVMHALVGGSIAANLAPLLFAPPAKLHLWHSANKKHSFEPAERIRDLVVECLPQLEGKVELHEMPSNSQVRAEEVLRPYFSVECLEAHCEVLVNITSGNRLMMLAVDSFARKSKQIQLIYRDADQTDLAYINNWHENSLFLTRLLRPNLNTDLEQAVKDLLARGCKSVEECFKKAVRLSQKQ